MQITVTSKHVDNSGDFQDYARKKANKLDRYLSHIEKIEIVLSQSHEQQTAELIVTPRRGGKIVGSASEKEMHAAINMAVDQMERRLVKLKGKVKEHRKGLPGLPADQEYAAEVDET